MRKLLFLAISCAPVAAMADSGSGSLGGSINAICAATTPGTALFDRCQELAASPNSQAESLLSEGQGLEELPGQGRASTRGEKNEQAASEDFGNGWSIFASIDLGRLDRSVSENEAAFDGSADRLTVGVNYQANPKLSLGLALNTAREDLDFTGSGSSNDSRMHGAVFMANFTPTEHLNFDAYWGSFNGSTENVRNIAYAFEKEPGGALLFFSTQAFGSSDMKRDVAGISGGWQWNKDAWSGGIGLAVDQSKTTLDAYTETGGDGFALEIPTRKIKSRTGALSFSVAKTFSLDWGVLIPNARAGIRKEFDNPGRQLTVQFEQDTTNTGITFDTSDPDTQWGEVAVGVSLVMKKGHQAFFEYRQRFAHEFLQERSLALGWRMEF
ncbi:MAG: autotransporter domain-containing protein [Arenimonas sp.]